MQKSAVIFPYWTKKMVKLCGFGSVFHHSVAQSAHAQRTCTHSGDVAVGEGVGRWGDSLLPVFKFISLGCSFKHIKQLWGIFFKLDIEWKKNDKYLNLFIFDNAIRVAMVMWASPQEKAAREYELQPITKREAGFVAGRRKWCHIERNGGRRAL